MFNLAVKGSERLVDQVLKNFDQACHRLKYTVGEKIVEEKVGFDPLEISAIRQARSGEELQTCKWDSLSFCYPPLSDYEQLAYCHLQTGTIIICLAKGRLLMAHCFQRDYFIFTVRQSQDNIEDGEYNFTFRNQGYGGYFRMVGRVECFGIFEAKICKMADISPLVSMEFKTSPREVTLIDLQLHRITRFNTSKFDRDYIDLPANSAPGCIVIRGCHPVGITTSESSKALRWGNLPGFRKQIQMGDDFSIKTTPIQEIGLYVLSIGPQNPLAKFIGPGSAILHVYSSDQLQRYLANDQWRFWFRQGPEQPKDHLIMLWE